ncbi:fimbrial protein [Enterobacter sp. R1(2018)]|uniref:fimbrial protein n=1 Tax=Enterobacter sp. R1(2018) TaxID=2447891 RepID=UPI000EB2F0CA|nr:fimbrial protein [Enterobacter sp. R1(2018)]RKQ38615.1 type 1 fimbrial protein [Enterobacter sp. R1(2018)]
MNIRHYLCLSFFFINVCQADTLAITGNVTAAPCMIDSANANQTIDFSQVIAQNLASTNNASDWKYLDIKLTNCPASTTFVKAQFTGKVDDVNNQYFANLGTAQNVALHLTDKSHTTTYNNLSIAKVSVNKERQALFPLSARIIMLKNGVKGGSFNSVIQISFTYE